VLQDTSALNPAEALVKVMRDMASGRIAFRNSRPTPENWDDFRDVSQGAAYMARAERSDAFSFLLESGRTRSLSDMAALDFPDSKQALQVVLELLRRKRMEAFAVDLSTDEALRSGMRVVRVVVPGLHPLSFHYRARYLGHRRLYEAPLEMGYPVSPEEQVNHWPQPFD
jgi:ribosomal protein S12 methylthiotransferase accessory factor